MNNKGEGLYPFWFSIHPQVTTAVPDAQREETEWGEFGARRLRRALPLGSGSPVNTFSL